MATRYATETSTLLRRGWIGGQLTSESKPALLDFYGGTPESEAAVMRGLRWLATHQQADGSWPLNAYGKNIADCKCQTDFEKSVDEGDMTGTAFGVLPSDSAPHPRPLSPEYRSEERRPSRPRRRREFASPKPWDWRNRL